MAVNACRALGYYGLVVAGTRAFARFSVSRRARSFCNCCSLEMYRRAGWLLLAEDAASVKEGDV